MREHTQRWPMTRRVWRQFALMDAMMTCTGVDVPAAARSARGAALAQARSICLTCRHSCGCRKWQEGLAGSAKQPLPPRFCPNTRFFRKHLKPDSRRLEEPVGRCRDHDADVGRGGASEGSARE
ncbi:MAG: hypothetical protein Kow0032_08090 [Methyloligellaceae bacterium]